MKKLLVFIFIISCVISPAYAKKHTTEEIITPSTQLEKRSFQSKTYNNIEQNKVLKNILNVLQDEGYIVYNANSLLGFIYAVKDFDTTDPNIDISKEFGFTKSRLSYNGVKVATLEAAVNVTEFGETLKVRVNFKRKLLNEYGNAQFIDDVSDKEFYANFYEKLDKTLSIYQKASDTNSQDLKNNEEEQNTSSSSPVIMPELLEEIHSEVEKLINVDRNELPVLSEPKANSASADKENSVDKEQKEVQKEETSSNEVNIEEKKSTEEQVEQIQQNEQDLNIDSPQTSETIEDTKVSGEQGNNSAE